MKRGIVAAAALMLLATSIGMASAQGGGGRQGRGQFGGRGMFGGGLRMLQTKEVQEELKMTQAQVDKVEAKQQDVQQATRDLFQNAGGFQNMSQEDRQKLMAKVQEIQTKAVNDILDTKQQKRFHQLELQQMGAAAFTRPDIAKELNLTDDQKSKIQAIQQAQQEKMREIFQSGGFGPNSTPEDRQKMQTQMQTLQKAAAEKIEAVLTDAQKAQWKTMQGEPFKFPAPQPRQPRQP